MPTFGRALHRIGLRHETGWFVLFMLVGTALRFYRLDAQSLWADEGIQYFIANAESLWGVFERVEARTIHPPLSFLIHYLFLQIDNSDFYLRLPSTLFGIGSLPLAYCLARTLTSRTAALCTLFVLAISPFHVWYSQEARMYAPLLFVSLLSTLFLFRALERGAVAWWGDYICVTACGVYMHIFMGLTIATHCGWVLLCHRRHLVWCLSSGMLAALIAFPVTLQWFGLVLRRIAPASMRSGFVTGGDRVSSVGWEGMPYTFYVYGAGFSLGPTMTDLHINRSVRLSVAVFSQYFCRRAHLRHIARSRPPGDAQTRQAVVAVVVSVGVRRAHWRHGSVYDDLAFFHLQCPLYDRRLSVFLPPSGDCHRVSDTETCGAGRPCCACPCGYFCHVFYQLFWPPTLCERGYSSCGDLLALGGNP